MTGIVNVQFLDESRLAVCEGTRVWVVNLDERAVERTLRAPHEVIGVARSPDGGRVLLNGSGDDPVLWDEQRDAYFELPVLTGARTLGWVSPRTAIFGSPWGGVVHVAVDTWLDAPDDLRAPDYMLGAGISALKYQHDELHEDEEVDEYRMSDSARGLLRETPHGWEVVEIIDGDCFNRYAVDEDGISHQCNAIVDGGTHMVRSDVVLCANELLQIEAGRVRRIRADDGKFVDEFEVPHHAHLFTDFAQQRAFLQLGKEVVEIDPESAERQAGYDTDGKCFLASHSRLVAVGKREVIVLDLATGEATTRLSPKQGNLRIAK